MIILECVRFKNFLSTGNCFEEISLNDESMTLIVGKNGSGKSSIIDAITFSLFGKPFRKINKPQLINTVNNKECVVEIEFSIGKNKYKVIRGIKPNIFEIIINGESQNEEASSRDQQDFLESSILKLNYKSFTQIVVLGSASFIPFMNLSANERRMVIEDILDIKIFSGMKQVLKEKKSVLKSNTEDTDYKLKVSQEKIDILEKSKVDMTDSLKDNIKEEEKVIKENEKLIEEQDSLIGNYEQHIEKYNEQIKDKTSIEEKISKLRSLEMKASSKIEIHESEKKFFEGNDTCPTCQQDINDKLKQEKIGYNSKKIDTLSKGMKDLEKEMISSSTEMKKIMKVVDDIRLMEGNIRDCNSTIRNSNSNIQECNRKIDSLKKKIDSFKNDNNEDELSALKNDISSLEKQADKNKKKKHYFDIASELLNDSGIKTRVIKKFLPVINTKVNNYLKEMNFYTSFELDETFSETIKSRHRDEFTYSSFSEGEKKRIDVAILLTWRYIASLKNSVNINLLFMDEIFDSSLDQSGIDDILKLFYSLQKTNLFVVSHRVDALDDKFPSKIVVKKNKNFTEMEKE